MRVKVFCERVRGSNQPFYMGESVSYKMHYVNFSLEVAHVFDFIPPLSRNYGIKSEVKGKLKKEKQLELLIQWFILAIKKDWKD